MGNLFSAFALAALMSASLAGCNQSAPSVRHDATNSNIASADSNAELSQAAREAHAEDAFNQIDTARTNYPPLGADPSAYNAAVSDAYHAWERAAETAYGNDWKSIWQEKHAGSTAGCDVAHANGMPYDACYQAAASEGDIQPLDDMLMKCPSWNDPSGAIFNPHDPLACAARARALAGHHDPAPVPTPDPDND